MPKCPSVTLSETFCCVFFLDEFSVESTNLKKTVIKKKKSQKQMYILVEYHLKKSSRYRKLNLIKDLAEAKP